MSSKVYILNRFASLNSNYTSWMSACQFECEIVDTYAPDWQVPADCGLIVTHMHYRWEEIAALRRIYDAAKVPILILADGILEYRNTWENPNIADGAVFQPLIGHKLACLGRGQARTVESWGNPGKCEVVGLPRLDESIGQPYCPVQVDGPFRVLVATANQPAFTHQQRAQVIAGLNALRIRFQNNGFVNRRPLEVTWRLTGGLQEELGIFVPQAESSSMPISDAIECADAVITTPSTVMLEAMLKRRPTAVLDFGNRPQYVPAAWTITAPAHVNTVLEELENPPAPKLLYQHSVLDDNLASDGKAHQRLFRLMQAMLEEGVAARSEQRSLKFPAKILEPASTPRPVEFDTSRLYQDNPIFQIADNARLQAELNHAIARLDQAPRELDEKDSVILRKEKHIAEMEGHLEHAETRIADCRARELKLAEQLQASQANLARKQEHINYLQTLFEQAQSTAKQLQVDIAAQSASLKKLALEQIADRSAANDAPPAVESTAPALAGPAPMPAATSTSRRAA